MKGSQSIKYVRFKDLNLVRCGTHKMFVRPVGEDLPQRGQPKFVSIVDIKSLVI